jgi:ABC-type enterochelin transport system permease subunit
MAKAVFLLCALTSLTCAALLLRAYARRHSRLLLWSGLCFVGLALNNGLLVIDRVILPDANLSVVRQIPAVGGIALLLWGLVWDAE